MVVTSEDVVRIESDDILQVPGTQQRISCYCDDSSYSHDCDHYPVSCAPGEHRQSSGVHGRKRLLPYVVITDLPKGIALIQALHGLDFDSRSRGIRVQRFQAEGNSMGKGKEVGRYRPGDPHLSWHLGWLEGRILEG